MPRIPRPSEVSLQPEVIGINLGLAVFSLLVFGGTSAVFNSILAEYSADINRTVAGVLPQNLRERLRARTLSTRGRIVGSWLTLVTITAVIESFLDTGPFLSLERLGVIITLLLASAATSGLEICSDIAVRRRLVPSTRFQYRVQYFGLIVGIGCVVLSRAMRFRPGFLYGIVGVLSLLPELTNARRAGIRAVIVLLVVLAGGLLAWLLSPLVAPFSSDLEAVLLSIFVASVQGIFFALLPLSFMDGGDLWNWRRWIWGISATVVAFVFYQTLMNPGQSDVQALRQNSVQTVLVLCGIFAAATGILWLLFPFRLRRRER